jgi:nicotinamidase/pyrazinamidase
MNALILVDLQHDFLPGGALAVPHGDEVLPVARAVMAKFPLVVATQDWHPQNHKSFASNNPGAKVGEMRTLDGLPQVMWPDHCVENTRGAELVVPCENVFRKGTNPEIDSYSGFFDNGRKQATGLRDFLRQKGVRAVTVLGLATDYCVKFTALDARHLGFDVTLIEDGCRGVELRSGDCARALEEMRTAGVHIGRFQ